MTPGVVTFRRICGTLLLAYVFAGCGGESSSERDTTEVAENEGDEQVADGVPVVLFFGDSITAGYGLAESAAFPALVQARADSAGFDIRIRNAGNSGETSAGGLRRIPWFLSSPVDLLFLELGANDGLRGIPLEDTRRNLQAIIDTVRAANPDVVVVVAGMEIPPNMGPEYTAGFRSIFPELARENGAVLIPFLLDGVAGVTELNLPDRIHPNADGHRIIAETVWSALRAELAELAPDGGRSEESNRSDDD